MAQVTQVDRRNVRPSGFRQLWASQRFQDQLLTTVCTILCILGVLVVLFPIGWMLSTSLKTRFEALQFPPSWLPKVPQWQNYHDALTAKPFGRYFVNTMFAKIHWLNSYKPLIIPHFFGSSYLIFLLRQFYRGLPSDYEETAILDGATYFGIWWRIILPLSKPALGAVAILSFMYHYGDFLGPLLYLSDELKYPVSLGLQQFQAPFGGTVYRWLMAASLVTIIPPILVFFATQRYFIQGIVVSGV